MATMQQCEQVLDSFKATLTDAGKLAETRILYDNETGSYYLQATYEGASLLENNSRVNDVLVKVVETPVASAPVKTAKAKASADDAEQV